MVGCGGCGSPDGRSTQNATFEKSPGDAIPVLQPGFSARSVVDGA